MDDRFEWWVVARLTAALVAGGVLGWERQLSNKPAGVRTHMLVSMGSALLVILGLQLQESTAAEFPGGPVRIDMTRIIAGIVGGIGFLGAGTIIQSRHSVRGLTTAASIWVIAAIGIGCGLGHFRTITIAAVLGLVVLLVIGMVERALEPYALPLGTSLVDSSQGIGPIAHGLEVPPAAPKG